MSLSNENNMNDNETENKLLNDTKVENSEEDVITTEPKADPKSKLSSKEELARLGLRENGPDPCLCLCCIFCLEACLAPTGGAPPIPSHVRYGRKLNKMHNWDNDSYDGNENNDNDESGIEWAVAFATNITGNHNNCSTDHHYDGAHHDDGGGDGGDGGGGGGGDGGGD